ncbi:transcriptional regulator with XRE-family HTH domain [Paenibacillus shirakamiensis]|uniref:Transcriptional regulator with XRE-family HTH domain n=1 Tax=Paenibacillus shirakamiensis TaxID=1265935 RepID=A0ABS4JJ05_9BACL|nr:DNA-binding protein [Paenibacillus shirakamiensis]MBP2001680.1 transcriptional regulator with XRE-family HTH domain [Paenibacillus shirakamiensis]
MDSMNSIRSEIEDHLASNGYTLTTFGHLSGMNRGTLSAILHASPPKPIAIRQLDVITEALGYPEGWFYHLYLSECFANEKVSRRRLESYLIRSAELNKLDCIKAAISRLVDNPKHIHIIFDIGEKLYALGHITESALFHEAAAELEKYNHSERLAISQYRLFMAHQGPHVEENWKAVIRFESFRLRLPENYQLDALLRLAIVCFALSKWKEVEKYADELRMLAQAIYREQLKRLKQNRPFEILHTERHFVVYYGQGYLLKAGALGKQGYYEDGKKFVLGYADLGWFHELDEVGTSEVKKFSLWAKANLYTFDMMMGKYDILMDYTDFLDEHPQELLPALVTIVECANKYDFQIDWVLEKYAEQITRFDTSGNIINYGLFYSYCYQIAIYHLNQLEYIKGISFTLQALNLAITIRSDKDFIQCVTLFEAYRPHSTEVLRNEYHSLMNQMRKSEENLCYL